MEIKDRILQAADALFMRNGIRSISMDDIATHLAISKKTLYKWFENKDQIVLGVMTRHLTMAQNQCAILASQASNAVEEMLNISQWADQQFGVIHPSIFYDLRKYYPATWSMFEDHKSTFILSQITRNLRRGIAEGLFRPNLDVEVLARLNLAQIEMAFDPQLYPLTEFTVSRVGRVLDEHFLLGVATLKGHRLFNTYRHVTEEE